MPRAGLPSGTVTFLFTDVEGSTSSCTSSARRGTPTRSLNTAARPRRRRAPKAASRSTRRASVLRRVPDRAGRARCRRGSDATASSKGPIRVRMGVHTGTPHVTDEGYVGVDVHRAARIAAAGHGGQVLVSAATAALLDPMGCATSGSTG